MLAPKCKGIPEAPTCHLLQFFTFRQPQLSLKAQGISLQEPKETITLLGQSQCLACWECRPGVTVMLGPPSSEPSPPVG